MDNDCVESALSAKVTEIAFFGTTAVPDGIELTLADGQKINAGTVNR